MELLYPWNEKLSEESEVKISRCVALQPDFFGSRFDLSSAHLTSVGWDFIGNYLDPPYGVPNGWELGCH